MEHSSYYEFSKVKTFLAHPIHDSLVNISSSGARQKTVKGVKAQNFETEGKKEYLITRHCSCISNKNFSRISESRGISTPSYACFFKSAVAIVVRNKNYFTGACTDMPSSFQSQIAKFRSIKEHMLIFVVTG